MTLPNPGKGAAPEVPWGHRLDHRPPEPSAQRPCAGQSSRSGLDAG